MSRDLAQIAAIVALGDADRPARELGVDRLGDEFLDNPPPHIDVTAVLDDLALEDALELGIVGHLGQRLAPRQLQNLRAEIERSDADRVRVGRQVAQREDVIRDRAN